MEASCFTGSTFDGTKEHFQFPPADVRVAVFFEVRLCDVKGMQIGVGGFGAFEGGRCPYDFFAYSDDRMWLENYVMFV